MKKFSLKKKTVPEGRVEKKIGGFSLKSKNASKDNKQEGGKKGLGFGDDEEGDGDKTSKNSVVELTSVEDVIATEDPDKPLSILAKQDEREKKEIAEKEEELAKEHGLLGFGLNEPTRHSEDVTEPPNTPSTTSTDALFAELSHIGGEEPTDESYSKVPVSKFGLAMLRGMGWNEEMEKERRRESRKTQAKSQPVRRRAPLAGLGANVHTAGR
ncbi:hypothetical protein PMKS-002677 [Pichia membranifaciens]|uniref:Pre-mRNA-splicing factor n=1 Tax=Pichia membranifaciens TaxID=4926 RepID=A0A1Q2YI51_9ASCO|nr:hypothetical protein PMKS-002677 [Pichia membranifaciens]